MYVVFLDQDLGSEDMIYFDSKYDLEVFIHNYKIYEDKENFDKKIYKLIEVTQEEVLN